MGGIGTGKLQISGVFSPGTSTYDARAWYTPGNEGPAVSTADYYHTHACQFMRPYDLDAMSTPGATVKAANGNNRYAWIFSAEHPEGGSGLWRDSFSFMIGFSNDPGVLPATVEMIIPFNNSFAGSVSIPGTSGYGNFYSDMCPSSMVYNPDDATYPFYLYTQGNPPTFNIGQQSILWKSSDLRAWVPGAWGPKSTDADVGSYALTSYQTVERTGTNTWVAHGTGGVTGRVGPTKWVSTDGQTWTRPNTTIYNVSGYSSLNFSLSTASGGTLTAASPIFTSGDTGKGIYVYITGGGGKLWREYDPIIMTYVNATTVTLDNYISLTFSNQPAVVEYGPIYITTAPPPDATGGLSFMGLHGIGEVAINIGGQLYRPVVEDGRPWARKANDDGMWTSLAPIDADWNASQVIPAIHVSSQYNGFYPGPGYAFITTSYLEDGVLHYYTELGNPGPHTTGLPPYVGADTVGSISATTLTVTSVTSGGYIPIGGYISLPGHYDYVGRVISQSSGTTGSTGVYVIENSGSASASGSTIYVNGGAYGTFSSSAAGRLDQQFLDYHTIAIDSLDASRAAPFGVTASCSSNTVTLSWMTTPLGTGAETQGYNVYRGTTSATQATALPGNPYSGTSATDTPTPGSIYYYKVVKVSNGVEQTTKYRVVHIYVG